jgi:fructose-bisphosphate aldolase, class I
MVSKEPVGALLVTPRVPEANPSKDSQQLKQKFQIMSKQELAAIAKAMVAPGKGLLAMDESNLTCKNRFEDVGIAPTEENRRAYRELILTTPGLGTSISGAILYDETIRQAKKDGTSFIKVMTNAGIIPGIKVDTGAKDLAGYPGEKITEGLDGLRERLAEYYRLGARFAKWRAVIRIGEGIPSHRGKRPCLGSLCCPMPGGRDRSDR